MKLPQASEPLTRRPDSQTANALLAEVALTELSF